MLGTDLGEQVAEAGVRLARLAVALAQDASVAANLLAPVEQRLTPIVGVAVAWGEDEEAAGGAGRQLEGGKEVADPDPAQRLDDLGQLLADGPQEVFAELPQLLRTPGFEHPFV